MKLKLSEAIRLGAMLGPQLNGHLMESTGEGSCAVGAALKAVGVTYKHLVERIVNGRHFAVMVSSIWPSLMDQSGQESYLWLDIAFKNNRGYTRKEIADWLVQSGNDCEAVLPDQAEEGLSSTPGVSDHENEVLSKGKL